MKPTLYLHIGQGRCGSTSIQRFATEQRDALAERGLLYPSAAELGLGDNHRGNAAAQTLYQMRGNAPEALGHLAGFLERQEHTKVLLSSEWLLNGDASFMRELVKTARKSGVRVVALAYVREQREWLISRYAQAIKSKRWTLSLEEHLQTSYRSRNLDYHAVFSRTAELFGRENLLIRVFERPKLIDGDVRVDAFTLFGTDVGDLVGDDPNANASPSVEEIEMMRFLNQRAEPILFNPRDFLRHSEVFLRQAEWEPSRELYRLAPPRSPAGDGRVLRHAERGVPARVLQRRARPALLHEDPSRLRAADRGRAGEPTLVGAVGQPSAAAYRAEGT